MSIVYISLGSNLGNRVGNIKKAIESLRVRKDIKIKKESSIYETEPVGGPSQGFFLNQVIEIETSFSPRDLVKFLKETEKKLGRKKEVRWEPRLIDLDILLFDNLILKEADLEIPHPRLSERKFVLKPLAEITPQLLHPVFKKKIKDLMETLEDDKEVRFYSDA